MFHFEHAINHQKQIPPHHKEITSEDTGGNYRILMNLNEMKRQEFGAFRFICSSAAQWRMDCVGTGVGFLSLSGCNTLLTMEKDLS